MVLELETWKDFKSHIFNMEIWTLLQSLSLGGCRTSCRDLSVYFLTGKMQIKYLTSGSNEWLGEVQRVRLWYQEQDSGWGARRPGLGFGPWDWSKLTSVFTSPSGNQGLWLPSYYTLSRSIHPSHADSLAFPPTAQGRFLFVVCLSYIKM